MRNDLTCVFYTANFISDFFANNVRKQLVKAINDLPLIVVSQKPMERFEGHSGEYENICIGNIGRSTLNIYRQALRGAKSAKTKYIALCEDDAFYSSSHFDHIPIPGAFAYDQNIWGIYTWTKPPVFSYKGRRSLWTLICERDLFIKTIEERFVRFPKEETTPLHLWGEPGKYEKQMGVKVNKWEFFRAKKSSVVFSHPEAFAYLGLGKRKKLGLNVREELVTWGSAKNFLKLYEQTN